MSRNTVTACACAGLCVRVGLLLALQAFALACGRPHRGGGRPEASVAVSGRASGEGRAEAPAATAPKAGPAESPRHPPAAYRTSPPADSRPVRFRPLAVELEVGDAPISVWQVDLVVVSGDARIVGVEGGTAEGFREPPYYDSAALLGGRIVLAAFNTHTSLARGRHRVATVHVREAGGPPTYELRLVAAAGPDGAPATAGAVLGLEEGAQP